MAGCRYCDGEMTQVDQCQHGIDQSVVPADMTDAYNCGDCKVAPGACHHPGCDCETCGACGGQAIGCGCGSFEEDEWRVLNDYPEGPQLEAAMQEAKAQAAANEATYWKERPNHRWRGATDGYLGAFQMGLFCRDICPDGTPLDYSDLDPGGKWHNGQIRWHVPCGPDDEGAHPDINRWHRQVARGRL